MIHPNLDICHFKRKFQYLFQMLHNAFQYHLNVHRQRPFGFYMPLILCLLLKQWRLCSCNKKFNWTWRGGSCCWMIMWLCAKYRQTYRELMFVHIWYDHKCIGHFVSIQLQGINVMYASKWWLRHIIDCCDIFLQSHLKIRVGNDSLNWPIIFTFHLVYCVKRALQLHYVAVVPFDNTIKMQYLFHYDSCITQERELLTHHRLIFRLYFTWEWFLFN